MTLKQTLVATYDSKQRAEKAIESLHDAGYDKSQISVLACRPDEQDSGQARNRGLFGGALGAALGFFAFLIPGVGPIIAAGPIIGLLSGAAIGIAAGGLVGALSGMGIPYGQAEVFARSIHEGKIMVTVSDRPDELREAAVLLARHKPVDAFKRPAPWANDQLEEHPTLRVYTMPLETVAT